jgi:hypothetical protein
MTDCPSGCGRPVAAGKLMCAPCWREVPQHLQADVMRTWDRYRRATARISWAASPTAHTARRKARLAYLSARDAAIESIQ